MAKLSKTAVYHFVKFAVRLALFLAALTLYIVGRATGDHSTFLSLLGAPWVLLSIGILFAVEMLLRFFPSSIESMGCQKQFRRNYLPKDESLTERVSLGSWRSTLAVAVFWLLLNGGIAALYFTGVIDEMALVLCSLFYSVADMICILFFCPFQTWFMKNKCCGSCRIYNWDYVMMFTPLILIPHPFARGLFAMAFVLFLAWEIAVWLHPERFSPAANRALSCERCKEKLCQHKHQLRSFLRKNAARIRLAETLDRAKRRIRGDRGKTE